MPRNKITFRADHLGSTIEGNNYSFEPQRVHSGFVVFSGGQFRKMGLDKLVTNPELAIILAVDEFEIPKSRLNQFNLSWNAERRDYVASVEHDAPTITVRDFVDVPVAQLFDAWFSLIFNQYTGAIGFKYKYAVNAHYVLLDHSTGKISRYYYVSQTYPQEIDSGSIDHNSSGFVKLNVTLAAGRVFRLNKEQMEKFKEGSLNAIDLGKYSRSSGESKALSGAGFKALSGAGFVKEY